MPSTVKTQNGDKNRIYPSLTVLSDCYIFPFKKVLKGQCETKYLVPVPAYSAPFFNPVPVRSGKLAGLSRLTPLN